MRFLHRVRISVFCKSDEENTLEKLKVFLPDEKIAVKRSSAEGLDGQITVIEILLEKERHINIFQKKLLSMLEPEQKKIILNQLHSRLDDELRFFLRFDKGKLMEDCQLCLTDSGNCYHITMHVAAYPANKQKAAEIIKAFFETKILNSK